MAKTALIHEIVNHSEGMVVNENGFTTNHIELQWSLLKRWVRSKLGGRLPNTQSRQVWRLFVDEFRFRKHVCHADGLSVVKMKLVTAARHPLW
eukprot:3666749-Amphidinium_carterae.1